MPNFTHTRGNYQFKEETPLSTQVKEWAEANGITLDWEFLPSKTAPDGNEIQQTYPISKTYFFRDKMV